MDTETTTNPGSEAVDTRQSSPGPPPLMRRYAEAALALSPRMPKAVRVTQAGEMWQKPGGRALRFTAVEKLAVEEVAFSWQARFQLFPLVSLQIIDGYQSGEGRLEGRIAGVVPVLKATGPDIDQGEAMRYLSELPWVPHAIQANQRLAWRQVDPCTVEVATPVGATTVSVRLQFDAAGDIVRALADARPRRDGNSSVRTPWAGVFADYREFGGVRVPTRAEVHWELPGGPFVYWRGTITSLELIY